MDTDTRRTLLIGSKVMYVGPPTLLSDSDAQGTIKAVSTYDDGNSRTVTYVVRWSFGWHSGCNILFSEHPSSELAVVE